MKNVNVEKAARRLADESGLPIEEARENIARAARQSVGDQPVPGPDGRPRDSREPMLHELTDAV